jgi:hypothetical protein
MKGVKLAGRVSSTPFSGEVTMAVSPERVSEAMVVWTGFGETNRPHRSEERVRARFGPDATLELMPLLRQLAEDFYAGGAQYIDLNLQEMGDRASAQFRQAHPEMSEKAVSALEWCFTFNFK